MHAIFSRQMCNLALAPLKRDGKICCCFFCLSGIQGYIYIYICLRFAGCQKSFIQFLHGGNDSHILGRGGFYWTARTRQTGWLQLRRLGSHQLWRFERRHKLWIRSEIISQHMQVFPVDGLLQTFNHYQLNFFQARYLSESCWQTI